MGYLIAVLFGALFLGSSTTVIIAPKEEKPTPRIPIDPDTPIYYNLKPPNFY